MDKSYGNAIVKNLPIIIACAVILFIFILTRFQGLRIVYGTSMAPSIRNGDLILTTKNAPESPKKGQIVLAQTQVKNEKPVIVVKRIVAVPGDTVQVINGHMYVNGEDELPLKELIKDPGIAGAPVFLGPDEYFLLGDNVNESADSRIFGPVKKDQIMAAYIHKFP